MSIRTAASILRRSIGRRRLARRVIPMTRQTPAITEGSVTVEPVIGSEESIGNWPDDFRRKPKSRRKKPTVKLVSAGPSEHGHWVYTFKIGDCE